MNQTRLATLALPLSLLAVFAYLTALGGSRSRAQDAPPARAQAASKPAPHAATPTLASEYAFEVRVTVAKPIVVGNTPLGLRRVVPITGGQVSGPKLKGQVLPGGADFQFVRSDATLAIEARYTLQAEDGTLIVITNRGLRRGPAEVIERLGRGEAVAPSEYYFRTVAEFEAPAASRYQWLNGSVFVGLAERQASTVTIRFFEIK